MKKKFSLKKIILLLAAVSIIISFAIILTSLVSLNNLENSATSTHKIALDNNYDASLRYQVEIGQPYYKDIFTQNRVV